VSKYINAVLMVIAAGISVATAALSDNHLSQTEAVNIAIAVFGAAAVYLAPNLPQAMYVKWGMAFLVAGLTALASVIGAGGIQAVTISEWVQIIAAALAAVTAGAVSLHSPTPVVSRSGQIER
jgi:hypothetical protein